MQLSKACSDTSRLLNLICGNKIKTSNNTKRTTQLWIVCALLKREFHSSQYLQRRHIEMAEGGGTSDDCIFCKFYEGELHDGKEPVIDGVPKILYKDEDYIVFPDIKAAAKHHYLVVTKAHIPNAKVLTKQQRPIVEKLVEIANKVLQEQGADMADVRLGFHWPPFNSISHLHLHAISPVEGMQLKHQIIFKPSSLWFVTADWLLKRLEEKKTASTK